jgi:hypothetical protein
VVKAEWKKVGKHEYRWSHYKLLRRSVFGGNRWQVFCLGHHENHKSCPQWAIASEARIDDAKKVFESYLEQKGG